MAYSKNNLIIVSAQALLWIAMLIIPACIDYFMHYNFTSAFVTFKYTCHFVLPLAAVYTINFYFLVPLLLYRKHVASFYVANLFVISASNIWVFSPGMADLNDDWKAGFYSMAIGAFFVNILIAGCATGFRYIIRWNDMQMKLKEERQKNAEAELAWLKNQLNPHFLFNTLNNISSLVQIDADTAQESIGQLSDLLRYTLYDSNQELVPLEGEVDFMNNYIQLMRLRCNELTTVEVAFQMPPSPMKIVPLLFISLIENAFKHGVNSRKKSFVRICLEGKGDDLVFTCENSDNPKNEENRIGSGVGLENLRRRLELTYPGRYAYTQELRGDIYFVQITLRNCL